MSYKMKKYFLLIYFISLSAISLSQNADSAWFVNNYTKVEQYIPMRDGVKLRKIERDWLRSPTPASHN